MAVGHALDFSGVANQQSRVDLTTRNENGHRSWVAAMTLGGISPPTESLNSTGGEISIRALSAEELGELSGGKFLEMFEPSALPVPLALLPQPHFGLVLESCLLVARFTRRAESQLAERSVDRIILALQLLGYWVSGDGNAVAWTEPGPRLISLQPTVTLPRRPNRGERRLSDEDLDRAVNLAGRIPLTCFQEPGLLARLHCGGSRWPAHRIVRPKQS
jgi:hypothetical protein